MAEKQWNPKRHLASFFWLSKFRYGCVLFLSKWQVEPYKHQEQHHLWSFYKASFIKYVTIGKSLIDKKGWKKNRKFERIFFYLSSFWLVLRRHRFRRHHEISVQAPGDKQFCRLFVVTALRFKILDYQCLMQHEETRKRL